jgi:hypothetical protein
LTVPLSESIYVWAVGIAVAVAIPFIMLIKQCNEEMQAQIIESIDETCKMKRDSAFYLSMFHISRRYHNQVMQIKLVCGSFLLILALSVAGIAYHKALVVFNDFYLMASLVLTGAFLVVNILPMAWKFINGRWH